jgi:tape measure domain-containing protein
MATENIIIRISAKGARAVVGGFRGIGGAAGRAGRNVGQFGGILQAAVGAGAVRQMAKAADQFTNINNRLRLISTGTDNLGALNEAVFAQAQRTRVEYETQAGLVSRIARASKDLGATQGQVLKVSEAVAQTFAISGASTQETAAASIQLGQALASGTLRGDELRSILENNARLSQTIAEGMGISVGELRTLGAEGKLTSKEVFGAILGDVERLNDEFSTLGPTFEQGMTQAQNAFIQIAGDLDLGNILGQAASDLASSITEARPAITEFVGSARILVSSIFGEIEQLVIGVQLGLNTVQGTAITVGNAIEDFFGDLEPEDFEQINSVIADRLALEKALGESQTRQEDLIKAQTTELLAQLAQMRKNKEAADALLEDVPDELEIEVTFTADDKKFADKLIDDLISDIQEIENTIVEVERLAPLGAFEDTEGIDRAAEVIAALKQDLFDIQGGDEALDLFEGTITDVEDLQNQIARVKELSAGGFFDIEGVDQSKRVLASLNDELRALQGGDEADSFVDRVRTDVEQLEIDIARVQELAALGFFEEGEDILVLERLGEELKKAQDELNVLNEFSKQAARNMQDSFAEFLFDPFEDGLRGMAQGFIDSLRKMAAELLAQQLLLSFFKSLSNQGGGIGQVGTAFLQGISGNAMGGSVQQGQPRIVGERGPEVFVPSQNGQIQNNTAMSQGGGQAAAPIIIVEQDPQAVVTALGTASGRSEIFKAVQADPAQFRAVLGVAQ